MLAMEETDASDPSLDGRSDVSAPGPRRYMSKSQPACDFCRSRKSACRIDANPPCRLCSLHRQVCRFTNSAKRRKRKLEAPLELALLLQDCVGEAQSHGEVSDRAIIVAASTESLHIDSNAAIDSPHGSNTAISSPDASPVDGQVHLAQDQSVQPTSKDEQQRSEVADCTAEDESIQTFFPDCFYDLLGEPLTNKMQVASLDAPSAFRAEVCGFTGDMDPYAMRHYQYSQQDGVFRFQKLSVRSVQDDVLPVQFLLSKLDMDMASTSKSDTGWTVEQGRMELEALVPTKVGVRLIDLYDCSFSVASRSQAENRRRFRRFINNQFPLISEEDEVSPSKSPLHFLAAMYLLALPFSSFDEELCIEIVYEQPSLKRLFELSWTSVNESRYAPTLSTVQTYLMLLLSLPTSPLVLDSAIKGSLIGSTVSTAHILGLQLDPMRWKIPSKEIYLRQTLSWTVFTIERWFSLSLGQPCHINTDDWLVTEAPNCNTSNVAAFRVAFSQLTLILSRVLCDL